MTCERELRGFEMLCAFSYSSSALLDFLFYRRFDVRRFLANTSLKPKALSGLIHARSEAQIRLGGTAREDEVDRVAAGQGCGGAPRAPQGEDQRECGSGRAARAQQGVQAAGARARDGSGDPRDPGSLGEGQGAGGADIRLRRSDSGIRAPSQGVCVHTLFMLHGDCNRD